MPWGHVRTVDSHLFPRDQVTGAGLTAWDRLLIQDKSKHIWSLLILFEDLLGGF